MRCMFEPIKPGRTLAISLFSMIVHVSASTGPLTPPKPGNSPLSTVTVIGGYLTFGIVFIACLMLMMSGQMDFFTHFYKSPIILILIVAGVLYHYEHFFIVRDVCVLGEWVLVQLGLIGLTEKGADSETKKE